MSEFALWHGWDPKKVRNREEISSQNKINFVKSFEIYLYHVIMSARYIMGTNTNVSSLVHSHSAMVDTKKERNRERKR